MEETPPAAARRRPSAVALLALAGVAVFWPATVAGGTLQPGYRIGRDVLSTLASYGARSPWIGIGAIAVLAAGHAALAAGIASVLRFRLAAALVAGSAAAGLLVALFRIHCPAGAARCGGDVGLGGGEPLTDRVHGSAVAAYAVFVALAMLAVAVGSLRSPDRGGRRLAAASGALGVASAWLASGLLDAPQPGMHQRAWLAVNSLWSLVMAAAILARRPRARPPGRPPR
jgi:hypothetical protein